MTGAGPGADHGDVERIEATAAALGPLGRRDVALGPLTTYRVGGRAAIFVEPASADQLAEVASVTAATGVDVVVIGNGSNLLVADAGFAGVAVHLGAGFSGIEIDGTQVEAGGAALLPVVARQTVQAGLTGFEWAVGVPGSIGGAVRMNAGGHGSDMAASLVGVRVIDLRSGEDETVAAARLDLAYRSSAVRAHHVVATATLALAVDEAGSGPSTLREIVRWRREHQPGGSNAGSVFTNPPGDSAGRLIELAGCKGRRVGTAEVSTKHANFIQADVGGNAGDVHALMIEVQEAVEGATGVRLHPETRLVGFDEEQRP